MGGLHPSTSDCQDGNVLKPSAENTCAADLASLEQGERHCGDSNCLCKLLASSGNFDMSTGKASAHAAQYAAEEVLTELPSPNPPARAGISAIDLCILF